MKLTLLLPRCLCVMTAVCLTTVTVAHAAKAPAKPAKTNVAASLSVTNVPEEVVVPIPRSTFSIPKSATDGCDPFFPASTRMFGTVATKTNATPKAIVLTLKALAGTEGRRFATINNRTFEAGEEGDVVATNGKVRVRCIEITKDAVIIEVGGVRQEMRMRQGF